MLGAEAEKSRGASASGRHYVLGRREPGTEGCLALGRYYALDKSLGAPVLLDAERPHVALVCGKRGYGKSYTLGVFAEEFMALPEAHRNGVGLIVVDTLGVFWTMRQPNLKEQPLLESWGMEPQGFDIDHFVPEAAAPRYEALGLRCEPFALRIAELGSAQWCDLFRVAPTSPPGILLGRVVEELREAGSAFGFDDLLAAVARDPRATPESRAAIESYLAAARAWGVFSEHGTPLEHLVRAGRISVLDLSALADEGLKAVVVGVLARRIFDERVAARRREELRRMGLAEGAEGLPLTWMFLDEAQVFLPGDRDSLAKDVLIRQWMRQGRQPGVGLVMATQRPASLDREVLSHCDLIVCHRLTAQEDIDALGAIRPTYMHGSIAEAVKKLGTDKGVAFLIDDTSEATHVIRVRPRRSWHGGEEPRVGRT